MGDIVKGLFYIGLHYFGNVFGERFGFLYSRFFKGRYFFGEIRPGIIFQGVNEFNDGINVGLACFFVPADVAVVVLS